MTRLHAYLRTPIALASESSRKDAARVRTTGTWLLREPYISISEITARCGFASQSTFTAAFRRIKGITPSAYRHALL